ncbi:type 4a pilus biogenesis protein PilO [Uliginosibacterium sp. 31-12]|uniref:type 4a pilus biogenesis protein PilO n=1 Tax=Uliginosibacterium sp. 31-12 TaxID=3062781 RepID=UPI0026E3FB6E|nr:type 4a pilus biogenesis protein PilO [Uliginosibacterium sp. 31-12]MDO6385638.1 type 4a pilus biogenesis protein PilO [Uliginosibacterium sp. 31-12]
MKRVNLDSAAHLRLQAELALWRFGWRLPLAAVALLAALLTGLVWLPAQYLGLQAAQAELERARQTPSGLSVQQQVPPLQLFRDTLAMQDATPTQLRVIHQKAIESGLSVAQLDMRRQADGAGAFSQLQVSMPVKGSYPSLKRFLGEMLGQMPSVSVDQLNIKREQTGNNIIEAQISLSIWQQPVAVTGGAR